MGYAAVLSRDNYERLGLGDDEDYPKTTALAASELRVRGYACDLPSLSRLVQTGKVVPPRIDGSRRYAWSQEHIDQAAEILLETDQLGPYARMHELYLIEYAQRLDALHAAWSKLAAKYPFQLNSQPQEAYFRVTIDPPRGDRPGKIAFEPCEDILHELEAQRQQGQVFQTL